MADFSQMSDADLEKLANPQSPVPRDFSHVSDEDLQRIASSPDPVQGEDRGVFSAFAHGAGDAATLGGFDLALTAALPSSLATRYKANAEQTTADHPIASLIGQGFGTLAGGAEAGLAAAGLRGLGAAGRLAARAVAPLALQKGQTIANAARMAVTGGAVSGASSYLHGGDAQDIALATGTGAIAGPVVGTVVNRVGQLAQGATGRAWGKIASRLNVDPNDLQGAFNNLSAKLGRPVSMPVLMDAAARGQLKDIAAANPVMEQEFSRAREAVDNTPVGKSVNNLAKDRDSNFKTAVDPIRDVGLRLSQDDADYLQSDVIPNAGVSQLFRKKLAAGVDNSELTIGDADTLRQRFWKQHTTNPGQGFDGIAHDLTDFVEQRSPEYAQAMQRYREDSNYLDGFSHGLKGGKKADASGLLALSLDSPEGGAGMAVGRLAKQERDNMASVIPGSFSDDNQAGQAAHAAGGALAHSPAVSAYHLSRLTAERLRLPPSALPQVAKMLADPNAAPQAIQMLRRAGARAQDIRNLALGTVAVGAANNGPALGGAVGSQINTGAQ